MSHKDVRCEVYHYLILTDSAALADQAGVPSFPPFFTCNLPQMSPWQSRGGDYAQVTSI